ncbi:MAG TPA: hypothetical protein VGN01_20490 [Acidobacteriaceae bacterium]|jgi:hypothetical protein
MKRGLLVVVLVLVGLIWVYRQRVFLRDPLGSVYRDDVKQDGVQLYINSLNDVLLIKDGPGGYRMLVQGWDMVPGAPVRLTCMHWMACLTEADNARIVALSSNGPGTYDPKVTMLNHEVSYVDPSGAKVRVLIR